MQMKLYSTNTLETMSHLFLSKKMLGKEYNIEKLHTLIKEHKKQIEIKIDHYVNYILYHLLEDVAYLESAYKQIQKEADSIIEEQKLKFRGDPKYELRAKFLGYPIPKAIVEEYKKVFKQQ